MKITNNQNIPLPLAVWLLHDDYDHSSDPYQFSVTTLMRPIKQLVLSKSVTATSRSMDISELVAARLGTSIHDSIEKAWSDSSKLNNLLKLLGISESAIERVRVNPLVNDPDMINIYLEQRTTKQVGKYKVSGKFDFVLDGVVQDFKSTSVYSWNNESKISDYCTQLSMYRWLNQHIIHEDYGYINYVFTDWNKNEAKRNSEYPQSRLKQSEPIKLMSLDETEAWVKHRLSLIEKYTGKPENEIPVCSDEELWRSESVYKYYSDPTKTDGRSTKNFSNKVEAETFRLSKGKGVVLLVPGEVRRCGYCPAFDVCQQKDQYI